jgi:uncharacterized protein (TIGR03000 family)
VATDFGYGRVAGVGGARGFVAGGHYTAGYSRGVYAGRGAVVRGGYYRYGAYGTGWWGAHPGAWRPFGWNNAYFWRGATWPVLTGWFGWTAPPVYYDYGNSIVYTGDQVYIDGQPGPTAAEYYQQAVDLSQLAPVEAAPPKKDEEWQSLGVFALSQGEEADISAVFQLAVNKAGTIRGNYTDVLTDTTLPVRGAVDKKTQRASWIVGDQKATVYDTGIANLTMDQAPLLIHFGKDQTQQRLLVRIREEDGQAPPAEAAEEAPPPPGPEEGVAKVTVIVPADAELYFDGTPTTLAGTERQFTTPPLEKGGTFSYSVRARWTEAGMPVEQTRKIAVKAGADVRVDFTSPAP